MATGQPPPPKTKRIPMIVDLAFATNVRFLDEHELHLDDVLLYKVTPILNNRFSYSIRYRILSWIGVPT